MWFTMISEFLASYCHLAILLIQVTWTKHSFQAVHLSFLNGVFYYHYYYYLCYYHNLNNNDNYLNPTTYITIKNQYFLSLFRNTTRRPWHRITNRAHQDQPYLISRDTDPQSSHQGHNSRQSEALCGYHSNRNKILRFLSNFGMWANITLACHHLGNLRKFIPKFTPPEGKGQSLP